MKPTIFICANETKNAGERDYMLAISKAIGTPSAKTPCHVFKNAGAISSFAAPLPHNKSDYAAIPAISPIAIENALKGDEFDTIRLVAVGTNALQPTLQTLNDLKTRFGNKTIQTSYITYKIENADELATLVRENITTYTTLDREILSALDAENAEYVQLVHLPCIPHTNTNIGCANEYQDFMALNRAQNTLLPGIIERGEPFVFVVLNAGFPKAGVHTPYTEDEAYKDGAMLASRIPSGAHLILADGGPRNGLDLAAGHNTRAKFAQGYADAMEIQGHYAPTCTLAPYDPTPSSPNAVKAGLHMAKMTNCVAFVSNAEGWGTMDGAIRHVNNTKRPLLAFPFNAQQDDNTHQSNIAKFNALGFTLLDHRTGITTPSAGITPRPIINSAQQIVTALGIESARVPSVSSAPRLTQ